MIELNLKIKLRSKKAQFCSKIDMCMRVNGKEMKEMAKVCKFGKMDLFIKDIGKII